MTLTKRKINIKKLSLLMLLSLFSISIFAADVNKPFNFKETDPEQIEVWLKSGNSKDAGKKTNLNIMKALLNKDSKNISYNDFKEIIRNTTKDKTKRWQDNHITMFIYQIPRFNGFSCNVLDENDFAVINQFRILILNYDNIPNEKYRAYFLKYTIPVLLTMKSNEINKLLNAYLKKSVSFKNEEIKSDLQLIKRMIYNRMSESTDMKNTIVKLELILKSVE